MKSRHRALRLVLPLLVGLVVGLVVYGSLSTAEFAPDAGFALFFGLAAAAIVAAFVWSPFWPGD
jgi:hypothetical protein